MNTNSNNCRRTFLKKCMVLTAGATVIGSGTKLMASPTDDWRWVGYCGVKCDNTCSWYSNNQCPSCKSVSYNCTVQKCAKAKPVPTCAHCTELDTCDDQFWTNNPGKYEDVKALRDSLNLSSIEKETVSKQDILVFPNPVQNYLTIQNPNNYIFNYELVNLNGQIIKKGTIENMELTLNISELTSGNYLFKVIRNKSVLQTLKVTKL
jgi:hypothetical protein